MDHNLHEEVNSLFFYSSLTQMPRCTQSVSIVSTQHGDTSLTVSVYTTAQMSDKSVIVET